MAQNVVQIPMSFQFRLAKIEWAQTSARITGWCKQQDGTADSKYLFAEVSNSKGTNSIKLSLDELPGNEKKQCLATLGQKNADEGVKQICQGFEPQLFVHNREAFLTEVALTRNTEPADAWQMREEFLRLKLDSETAFSFLQVWGRWNQLRRYVQLSEMVHLQRSIRDGLTSSPAKWFAGPGAQPIVVSSRLLEFPYFAMKTDSCQIALGTATTIDLLRRLEFKTCARGDCEMPFEVTSNHERAYCSQYCAHLASVRRNRKAAKGQASPEKIARKN
jgi:hypothetical protein